ncbi:uncharacterized protein TNCV_4172451 [Trichonephila clavipes]|nr:uncharacterized protein TNCV_4172451 [Trichonephila clavipes]
MVLLPEEVGEKGLLETHSPTFRIDSSRKDMRRTGFEGSDWRQKVPWRILRVDELMHIKTVRVQSPCDGLVRNLDTGVPARVSLLKRRTQNGNRFNSCQVNYSQFGLAIHQNDHQAKRRFVEWAQNEIAVVPDFHKRILFSDEAHFWLNGYVNKQNCRIWNEANPQVYVETPLHPEKLTVWCALWAGGILLQKR